MSRTNRSYSPFGLAPLKARVDKGHATKQKEHEARSGSGWRLESGDRVDVLVASWHPCPAGMTRPRSRRVVTPSYPSRWNSQTGLLEREKKFTNWVERSSCCEVSRRLGPAHQAARAGDLTPSTDTPPQPPPNRHIPAAGASSYCSCT